MTFFSKFSGTVVTISEADRTDEITKELFPIFNYLGSYVGYYDHGTVVWKDGRSVDPWKNEE